MLAVTSCSENTAFHSPCGSTRASARAVGTTRRFSSGGNRGPRQSPPEKNRDDRFQTSPSPTASERIRLNSTADGPAAPSPTSLYSSPRRRTGAGPKALPSPSRRNRVLPPSPLPLSPNKKTRPRSTFSYPEPIVTASPRQEHSRKEERNDWPTTPKKIAADDAALTSSAGTPTTCKDIDFDSHSDDDSDSPDDNRCARTKSGSLLLLQFDPCERDHLTQVRQVSGAQYQFKTSDGKLGMGEISEMDLREEEGKNAHEHEGGKKTDRKGLAVSAPSQPPFPNIPKSPRRAPRRSSASKPSVQQPTVCPGSPASCTALRSRHPSYSPAGMLKSSKHSTDEDASSCSTSLRTRRSSWKSHQPVSSWKGLLQPGTACPGSPASCTALRSRHHPDSPAGSMLKSFKHSTDEDASSRSTSLRKRRSSWKSHQPVSSWKNLLQPGMACPGSPASCTALQSGHHTLSSMGSMLKSSKHSTEEDASSRTGSCCGRRSSFSRFLGGGGSQSAKSNGGSGKQKYSLRTQSEQLVGVPPFSQNEIGDDCGSHGTVSTSKHHSKETLELPTESTSSSPQTALPTLASKKTSKNTANVLPRVPYAPPSPLVPARPVCSGPASDIAVDSQRPFGKGQLSGRAPSSPSKCRRTRTGSAEVPSDPEAKREFPASGESLPKQQPLPVLNRSPRRTKPGAPSKIPSSMIPPFSPTPVAQPATLCGVLVSPTKSNRKVSGRGNNDRPLSRAHSLRWLSTCNERGEERVVSPLRAPSSRHLVARASSPQKYPGSSRLSLSREEEQTYVTTAPATTGTTRDESPSPIEAAVSPGKDSGGTHKKSSIRGRIQNIGRYFRNSTRSLQQQWQHHQEQQQPQQQQGEGGPSGGQPQPRTAEQSMARS